MKQYEVNFDGLVGPTHNYGGLSFGNVASSSNAQAVSNPKEAAKQGLTKMKALADLGMQQGILAPQERPNVHALRRIGFTGTDSDVLHKAASQAPEILQTVSSASSMWTANAATVSPGADTANGKVHFTPANLTNKFHRSLEPTVTGRILKAIFNNNKYFEHHLHLPDNDHFGDEGAANHTRLCADYGQEGVELFVFGKYGFDQSKPAPQKYPARQTFEASQAIARLHGLSEENVVFMQQNPEVIDLGVFHNDVISVGNQNVLFYHEQAFLNTNEKFDEIRAKFIGDELHFIKVSSKDVSLSEAVKTYLFNTQILTLPGGNMAIIAPTECQESSSVSSYLASLTEMNTPIKQVKYFDVKQSMRNGGGPACLRLRVALTEDELNAVNQNALLTEESFARLNAWVDKHYRDRLTIDDLKDPQLLIESRTALDELTQIMKLGSVYTFQQD